MTLRSTYPRAATQLDWLGRDGLDLLKLWLLQDFGEVAPRWQSRFRQLRARLDSLSPSPDAAAIRQLYVDAHAAVRELVFVNPLLRFGKLVFYKRYSPRTMNIHRLRAFHRPPRRRSVLPGAGRGLYRSATHAGPVEFSVGRAAQLHGLPRDANRGAAFGRCLGRRATSLDPPAAAMGERGKCQPAVFHTTDDPDYRALLDEAQEIRDRMRQDPTPGMKELIAGEPVRVSQSLVMPKDLGWTHQQIQARSVSE